MKTFDFTTTGQAPEVVQYFQSIQGKRVSEEQFIKDFCSLPRRKLKVGQAPGRNRSPSRAKRLYRNLKEEFGFFK